MVDSLDDNFLELWRAVEGCRVDIIVAVSQAWVLVETVAPEHLARLPRGADKMVTALLLGPTEGARLVPRADGLDLGQVVAPPHFLAPVALPAGPGDGDGHIVPHSAGVHGDEIEVKLSLFWGELRSRELSRVIYTRNESERCNTQLGPGRSDQVLFSLVTSQT